MKIIIKQRVQFLVKGCSHRRRINTEEKAKVVAAAWVKELIKFLAALAILRQDDFKNRLICTRTS